MDKVLTFGEILMRLSTERHLRFSQANFFGVTYGGGEFNVAVTLANFGIPVEFITRLPETELGDCALMEMRKRNVNTNHIIYGGDRLGIYFLETGAGTRGSKVVYDRKDSAIANIDLGMIDWETVFKDVNLFHWSGVTPAISQNAAAVCLEALEVAHRMGITISSDLNYRSKLWHYGKQPKEIMPQLLKYSNIILGDLDTAFFMMGKESVHPDYKKNTDLPKLYDKLFEECPNLDMAATTLRYSVSASHQQIGGLLYDGKTIYRAEVKDVAPVVDRVGSGDAFMGGLIYSLLKNKRDKQSVIDFAVASCCLKHTISGDYNLVSVEEVEKLMGGDASGCVVR